MNDGTIAEAAAPERRILLVEDQRIIALEKSARLNRAGYETVIAGRGSEALEKFNTAKASGGAFDLILMDIDLGPGMDGIETADRILAEHRVPIVFLTSHTEQSVVERVRKVSRYGYVVKSSGDLILKLAIETALDLFDSQTESERRERELHAVYDQAPVMMIVVDDRLTTLKANRETLAHTGFTPGEAEGLAVGNLLRCIRTRNGRACGDSPECRECAVRRLIEDTASRGGEHRNVIAPIETETPRGLLRNLYLLSTALLEDTPRPSVLVSITRTPEPLPDGVDGALEVWRALQALDTLVEPGADRVLLVKYLQRLFSLAGFFDSEDFRPGFDPTAESIQVGPDRAVAVGILLFKLFKLRQFSSPVEISLAAEGTGRALVRGRLNSFSFDLKQIEENDALRLLCDCADAELCTTVAPTGESFLDLLFPAEVVHVR